MTNNPTEPTDHGDEELPNVEDIEPMSGAETGGAGQGGEAESGEDGEDAEAGNNDEPAGRPSVARQLVDLARESYTLGVSDIGEAFAYQENAPHIAVMLRASRTGLRQWLAAHYFDAAEKVPSGQALTDALNVLEGYALREQPTGLHMRMAARNGHVYLDTADENNRVIEICGGTWKFTESAPVLFQRGNCTLPLPEPAENGDLDRLWSYVNIDEPDRPLLLAYMVAALIQDNVPHAILALLAENGSAKTTFAKIVVSLIDPSSAPTRTPPKDIEAWRSSAGASWVVALDNLSTIPGWLSDAMCRAVTGDAMIKRALYTDADLSVVPLRRCLIITGIDLGALAGDLADRTVTATLHRIDANTRRSEDEFHTAWQGDRSAVFTGLLNLAARVHQMLPTATVPGGMPRMADFAKVLVCIDQILSTDGLGRYRDQAAALVADSLNTSPFISALARSCYQCEDKGARQILDGVHHLISSSEQLTRWPKDARQVTAELTKNAPALRALGWQIEHDNARNKYNIKRWTITPPKKPAEKASSSSPSSPKGQKPSTASTPTGEDSGEDKTSGRSGTPRPGQDGEDHRQAAQASPATSSPSNPAPSGGNEDGEVGEERDHKEAVHDGGPFDSVEAFRTLRGGHVPRGGVRPRPMKRHGAPRCVVCNAKPPRPGRTHCPECEANDRSITSSPA